MTPIPVRNHPFFPGAFLFRVNVQIAAELPVLHQLLFDLLHSQAWSIGERSVDQSAHISIATLTHTMAEPIQSQETLLVLLQTKLRE
jgi:hypothetical protein